MYRARQDYVLTIVVQNHISNFAPWTRRKNRTLKLQFNVASDNEAVIKNKKIMRRIFKVVFYMRGNYVNKEGKSAIMLRITLNGEKLTIGTTGITVTPSLWNMKRQRLRGKSTEAMQVNHGMDNIKAELQAIANRLEIEGGLCLEAVKTAYLHSGDGVTTIGGLFDGGRRSEP